MCNVTIQPGNGVADKRLRVRLELQRMVSARILNGLLVACRKSLQESARATVVNDAVLFGEQGEDGHGDVTGGEVQIPMQPDTFDQEAGSCVTQSKGIVSQEL